MNEDRRDTSKIDLVVDMVKDIKDDIKENTQQGHEHEKIIIKVDNRLEQLEKIVTNGLSSKVSSLWGAYKLWMKIMGWLVVIIPIIFAVLSYYK